MLFSKIFEFLDSRLYPSCCTAQCSTVHIKMLAVTNLVQSSTRVLVLVVEAPKNLQHSKLHIANEKKMFELELVSDIFAEEASWTVQNICSGEEVMRGESSGIVTCVDSDVYCPVYKIWR
jgi:hypothetical protein